MNTVKQDDFFRDQPITGRIQSLSPNESNPPRSGATRTGRFKTYENHRTAGYSLWHKAKTAVRNVYWRLTLTEGRWYKVRLESGQRTFYFWSGSVFQTKTRDLKDHYHIVKIVEVLQDWYEDAQIPAGD